jgi:uncharacterized protein (DUF433 family)
MVMVAISYLSSYEAKRAAALAGVPERTVYDWAKKAVVVPSVSATPRHMRWSYADLLELRLVDWLRHAKADTEAVNNKTFPATSMREVRRLLSSVEHLGGELHTGSAIVEVDRSGKIVLTIAGERFDPLGFGLLQPMVPAEFALIAPYLRKGPHLVEPKANVRILPGTLAGQPHVKDKRIPTELVVDLADQGFPPEMIRRAYPALADEDIRDAIDFEWELRAA